MTRTQEDRKAETRHRLLDAAAELFAREGFHAVSTDTVADAADRTSGSVYAHFGGKEGLLLGLLDVWEARTASRMRDALDSSDGRADKIEALWAAFSAGDGDGPDGLLLEHELWLHAARSPEVAPAVAARYAAGREVMGRHFTEWYPKLESASASDAASESDAVPPDALGGLVLALLLGLEMQRRIDPAAVPDHLAVSGLRRLFGARLSAPVPKSTISDRPTHNP